jgi:hypothetical protein
VGRGAAGGEHVEEEHGNQRQSKAYTIAECSTGTRFEGTEYVIGGSLGKLNRLHDGARLGTRRAGLQGIATDSGSRGGRGRWGEVSKRRTV